MTVWCHLPTIFKPRYVLRIVVLLLLCVALTTTYIFSNASAAADINRTISFQGRLFDTNGTVVPDGYYNMQFKLYQDGSGTAANNPDGTLKWTESYVNNGGTSGVQIKNGYFAVRLGSATPFGSSVDWNQDTLWLSMNIAGYATSCTTFGSAPCSADGEMLPMKALSATPYAMNAGTLGGIDSSGFIHSSGVEQSGSFNITGSGTASTLQGNTSVLAPLFDRADAGTLSIGNANAGTIEMGTNAVAHTINIGTSDAAAQEVTIGSVNSASSTTVRGDTISLETGSGQTMVLSDGNVGIGNTAPTNKLAINSYGTGTHDTAAYINTGAAGQSGLVLQMVSGQTANPFVLKNASGNTLAHISSSAAMFINGSYTSGTGTYGTASVTSASSQNVFLRSGTATGSGNTSGNTTISSGAGTDGASSGNITIDNGTAAGTAGSIGIGTTSTSAVNIGRAGITTNILSNTLSTGSNTVSVDSATALLVQNTSNTALLTANTSTMKVAITDLDTGNINTTSGYKINGNTALTDSALSFSGASPSTISSASGQVLSIESSESVSIKTDGATRATFNDANLQVGDGLSTGIPTLLTLDKATSAPTTTLVGSMYYNTTSGKVECYEADGWGSCSAAPDNFVTLSPEFAGMVSNNSGTGTLTTGFCSDTLNILDGSSAQATICGTNETYNFYKWTTAQGTNQTRTLYVTYQLPTNFKNFVAGTTSLKGRTDNANSSVTYQIYRNNSAGLSDCGSAVTVSTGSQTTWQQGTASGTADPSTCSFQAGDSILFKIDISTRSNSNSYLSNLNFTFSSN